MEITEILKVIGICILAYLFGSVPFGKIIGYFNKIDVQKIGSGNIGATNLLRAAGSLNAFLTLGLDALKGGLPVYLAMRVFNYPWQIVTPVAAFVLLGACFSIWLKLKVKRWKAGKGVSALIGILAVILGWQAWLTVLIVWFFFIFLFIANRKMSGASLILISGVPILYLIWPIPLLITFWPAAIFLIGWRHRENIEKLIKRTEKPINIPIPENAPEQLKRFFKDFSLEELVDKYLINNRKKKP